MIRSEFSAFSNTARVTIDTSDSFLVDMALEFGLVKYGPDPVYHASNQWKNYRAYMGRPDQIRKFLQTVNDE